MSTSSRISNAFIDASPLHTWDDPDCAVDTAFEAYLESSFPGKVWTFCSRYLTGTDEEERFNNTMLNALTRKPARVDDERGSLFNDNNERRGAIIIRSQMGTGKTSLLRSLMKKVDEAEAILDRPLRIVCLSSRVSFGHTLMEVLVNNGFQMYNMLERGSVMWDEYRLIISMESVHRLQNPYKGRQIPIPDLFIWDEYTCGAIHMKSPTILEKGILIDYISELARSGKTQFLYMDAYYDSDGIDIIKDMHPETRIGVLWNVKRPARRGILNFHYTLDNYDQQIIDKIERCKVRWAAEMAAADEEERDPIFNDQLVFCFMSKKQLDNKVKSLTREYPNLFAPRYVCRIHSDCDADALRTTLSATTHWPRYVAIFYTSSVLVGTNYDIEQRPDIKLAMKNASTTDDAARVRKTILEKVCVDVFCNADSQNPCAISLAQMMARTRYAGLNGKIHFFIPPCCADIERFPTSKHLLVEYLDRTRCYLTDAVISRDSGCIKATTIVDEATGDMYVSHVLQHNTLFVKFYIYSKLCANRSKISFISHLKQILDGFSETIFNSTVEDIAPLFYRATDAMKKRMESSNLASKAKRGRDDVDAESYSTAMGKIVSKMKDGQLNFTSDILRHYDMNERSIKLRKTMNDELVYDILRFLMYFGINDLPDRADNASLSVLTRLVLDVHPWYKDYREIYELMRQPSDKNTRDLLASVLAGKKPDAIAAQERFRSLLILLSLKAIFPQFVEDTDDGPRIKIPPSAIEAGDVFYETALLPPIDDIPITSCCLTASATYDIIFGDVKNVPNRFDPGASTRSKQCHIPKLVNFALTVCGFDFTSRTSKISHADAVRMGIRATPRSTGRMTRDDRVASTRFTMGARAHDIEALYMFKSASSALNLTRSFDRASNARYLEMTKRARGTAYDCLFTLPMIEPRTPELPSPGSLDVIEDIRPLDKAPSPGCVDFYISRNPEFPMRPVVMPFEETYDQIQRRESDDTLSDALPATTVSSPPLSTPSRHSSFDHFFRSRFHK